MRGDVDNTTQTCNKPYNAIMSELIILGAGASFDFYASYRGHEQYDPPQHQPFPLANEFFKKAIYYDILEQDSDTLLLRYLRNAYGFSFNDLSRKPINIEQVYIDLSNKVQMEQDDSIWWELAMTRSALLRLIEETIIRTATNHGLCVNHRRLAQHCISNSINIVSFNWDTLIDDCLQNTGNWDYSSGYGFNFFTQYKDRVLFQPQNNQSPVKLIKPHGSINWFRYKDIPWSDRSGYTCEPITDNEKNGLGLSIFVEKMQHPRHMRLNQGLGFNPPLKKPVEVAIIPPGENFEAHSTYRIIHDQMEVEIASAQKITVVGFGMKDTDADSRNLFQKARTTNSHSIKVEIVNRAVEDPDQRKKFEEVCNEWLRPCDISMRFSSFREYCAAL
jgi:hypothetical protein